MMKIGLVAQGVYPFDFGGHEVRMTELGKRFAKENEVHVFVPQKGTTKYPRKYKGFHIHPIGMGFKHPIFVNWLGALIFSFRVRKKLADHNFDIIDIPYCSQPLPKTSVKVISTNGALFSSFKHRPFGRRILTSPLLFVQISLARLKTNFADKIICISELAKKETMEHFGAPESKIFVIKNGVSEEFNPRINRVPLRSELGYSDDDFVVFYAGRLNVEKGVQDLIMAAKKINDLDLKVLIAGGGKYRKKLEAMSRSLRNRVRFVGKVNYHEMPRYYAASDLFVLPTYWEIQPLACLEAMACGTPVVATNVGGVPEIVTDGFNGALVPSRRPEAIAEKIKQLKNDEDLRRRFIKNGLKFAKGRTWEKIAEQTLKVYEDP
jgi:glycosyltransferase involved in cell wall biosynthesis